MEVFSLEIEFIRLEGIEIGFKCFNGDDCNLGIPLLESILYLNDDTII